VCLFSNSQDPNRIGIIGALVKTRKLIHKDAEYLRSGKSSSPDYSLNLPWKLVVFPLYLKLIDHQENWGGYNSLLELKTRH
jgi:hypothetical protein